MPTAMVEHAFRGGRKAETRDQDNKKVSSSRKWKQPVDTKLMSTHHNYTEVPWERQQPIGVAGGRTLPKALFKAPTAPGSTSFHMRGIVSTQSPGGWPTTSPATYPGLASDLALLKHCHKHGCWALAGESWQCQLVAKGMLIKHKSASDWCFSLGSIQGGPA
eukprot:4056876-Lingulodinium_polyedra.AAC.1